VISSSVAKPPPPTTPQLPAPATPLLQMAAPQPDGDFEPDSTEYWKAKAKLASAAAQELFARAKEMYTTPLTLKDSHPSWQVRKASPPKDDAARGKQRVKGAWGDMDSNQMLEHLNLEEEKEEQKREEAAEKKRDMAERRAEREELERERKEMKQLQLELERAGRPSRPRSITICMCVLTWWRPAQLL